MCVGLPGRVVEIVDEEHHIVRVEVAGETHDMSAALIAHEGVAPGDWVEIHMGHAFTKLTEDEAQQMLDFMEELDAAHRGELEQLEAELDAHAVERDGEVAPEVSEPDEHDGPEDPGERGVEQAATDDEGA